MTHNTCSAGCTCQKPCEADCVERSECELVVSAGDVCGSECAGYDMPSIDLPGVTVPVQTYRVGFCPPEALCKGTLFPELVSPYTRGC